MLRMTTGAALAAAFTTTVSAAPVLDGSITGDSYGAAAAVQTVETGFGDNASELNAAYATIDGGTLYLALTGNLEPNFNKINIFIASDPAAGENVLTASVANGGQNPNNDGNRIDNLAGLTFDSGFTADYHFILRGNNDQFDLDFATLGDGSNTFEAAGDVFGGTFTGANSSALPTNGIGIAFDNSNSAGVGGGNGPATDQSAALAVQTGFELAIPLSAIGNPTGAINIQPSVGNGDQNFFANQTLGGLPIGTSNLGGDGAGNFTGNAAGVDYNAFAGDQFFTVVVPEPASAALLGLGLGVLACRRRGR